MTAALEVTDATLLAFAREVGDGGSDGSADPVTPVGGGTRAPSAGPLSRPAREVRAPSGVVTCTPAEMTVVVRAGTPVAELHAELAAVGQRTGLPERASPGALGTVGGALAVGESHLDRRVRGALPTAVLQLRYVSAEGRVVTGGGPTVKNVTGFDLPRLLVGSWGTLGVLAEAILRTNPIPPVSRWLQADGADPAAVSDALLRPAAVLWDGLRTWVHLEGHGADVADDVARLGAHGSWQEVEGPPSLPPHRWSLTPGDALGLAPVAGTGPCGPAGTWVASVGVGTVWAGEAQPPRAMPDALVRLNRRVKGSFDPGDRLNPGRFDRVIGGAGTGA